MSDRLVRATGVAVFLLLAVLLLIWGVRRYVAERLSPDPVAIAGASLRALREQDRLPAFSARIVAFTPARSSRQPVVTPGLVRYEVDLGRLTDRDVAWNGPARTLSVRLPPVELNGPRVDPVQFAALGSPALDDVSRRAGEAELFRQAHEPANIRLARDAARRTVERSFALPLASAGVDAKVAVRFADEPEVAARIAGE